MSIVEIARRRWSGMEPLPIRPEDIASSIEAVQMPSILDKLGGQAGRLLASLREQEQSLDQQIAERTETLRQVRVSIEAFTACERTIEAGKMPMAAE